MLYYTERGLWINKEDYLGHIKPKCANDYPMILLVDSEGPDQTVQMNMLSAQADLGHCSRHVPENTFLHGVTHLEMLQECMKDNHIICMKA